MLFCRFNVAVMSYTTAKIRDSLMNFLHSVLQNHRFSPDVLFYLRIKKIFELCNSRPACTQFLFNKFTVATKLFYQAPEFHHKGVQLQHENKNRQLFRILLVFPANVVLEASFRHRLTIRIAQQFEQILLLLEVRALPATAYSNIW